MELNFKGENTKSIVLVLAVVLLAGCVSTGQVVQTAGSSVIDACAAGSYEGKYVTVKGYVAGVSYSDKSGTTFLNFGQPYPNNCFTSVIFSSDRNKFTNVFGYEGKTVKVTGVVRSYQGKPEIILNSPSQIEIA